MNSPEALVSEAPLVSALPLPARPNFGFARRHGATVVGLTGDLAHVIHRPDVSAETLLELRRYAGRPLQLEALSQSNFEERIRELYESGSEGAAQMAADMDQRLTLEQIADAMSEPADLMESEDDAPIIRLINAMLAESIKQQASDIHIEPYEGRLVVRFRIDGVLREVLSPHKSLAAPVVSRIKVMAKLDIAEKRLPQDGRIGLRIAGRPVDVRVSTIPASFGERVVLRLLDKQAGRLDLSELGMDPTTLDGIDELIHRPHGVLLVTGPTGSGKTTTLYAALGRLNDASCNIMTVEDPIEYYIDGIGQTQVNAKVDMSFARGLRAILRQDPDVVMVGEIRDLETASIAVQASLTGHQVLSTLHTNSAVGAVTRLRDMGIEPFLLSSSINGVIAQRLVRRLDPETREAYQASQAELAAFGRQRSEEVTLYRPNVELAGRHGGYKGRSGLYELVVVDEAMRTLIHDGAGEQALEAAARAHTPGILDDGWRKCRDGHTSVDEVLKVTRDEG